MADLIAKRCLNSGDNISLLVLSLHDMPTPVVMPDVLPAVASHVDSPQKGENPSKVAAPSQEGESPNKTEPEEVTAPDAPTGDE